MNKIKKIIEFIQCCIIAVIWMIILEFPDREDGYWDED